MDVSRLMPSERPVREQRHLATALVTAPAEFSERSRGAAELLRDLAVPDNVVQLVRAPLEEAGFAVEHPAEVTDPFGTAREVTLGSANGSVVYLIHLPDKVVKSPTEAHRDAVNSLEHIFQTPHAIVLFSKGLDRVPLDFGTLFGLWRNEKQVPVSFCPWGDIEELEGTEQPGPKVDRLVKGWLRQQAGAAAPAPSAAPVRLSGKQKGKLDEALQANFSVQDLRRLLDYHLEADINGIPWERDRATVVYEVVAAANREGWVGRLIVHAGAEHPHENLTELVEELGLGGP